jgi:uncharacterized membrane protein YhaH (DUF805 family)
MNIIEAIKSGYKNYVNFSGRSQRSAYWWWFVFQMVIAIAIALVEGGGQASSGAGSFSATYNAGPVGIVWSLAHLIPNLSVGVRRLHDTDRSGWWLLIALIPLVGAIILIVWFASKGTTGANRFGNDPLQDRAGVF